METLVGTFNKEMALEGTFSVHCEIPEVSLTVQAPLSSPDSGSVAAAQVVRGSEGGRALPGEAGQLPPGPRISPHQRHHVLLHQGEVGERLRPRGQGVLPVLGGGRVLVNTPLPGETCMGCL